MAQDKILRLIRQAHSKQDQDKKGGETIIWRRQRFRRGGMTNFQSLIPRVIQYARNRRKEAMAMRKLTIGSIFCGDNPPRFFPFIRLRGRWLENMGWLPGQIIEVTATKEEIVIRKANGSTQLTMKGGNENDNQPAKNV